MSKPDRQTRRTRNVNLINEEINKVKTLQNNELFLKESEIQIKPIDTELDVEMPTDFKRFHKENKDRVFNIQKKKDMDKLSITDFMKISEYRLMDQFNYFDQDGGGELAPDEMHAMGAHLGISKRMMDRMIKEIDVDGDGTVSAQEWVKYVMDTRANKDSMRKSDNILLDIFDKEIRQKQERNSNINDRKYNVNIFDDYKLNDIELSAAYNIAKNKNGNLQKSSLDFTEFYKDNITHAIKKPDDIEEEFVDDRISFTGQLVPNNLIPKRRQSKRYSKNDELTKIDPECMAKIRMLSTKFQPTINSEENENSNSLNVDELDEQLNSTKTNINIDTKTQTQELLNTIFHDNEELKTLYSDQEDSSSKKPVIKNRNRMKSVKWVEESCNDDNLNNNLTSKKQFNNFNNTANDWKLEFNISVNNNDIEKPRNFHQNRTPFRNMNSFDWGSKQSVKSPSPNQSPNMKSSILKNYEENTKNLKKIKFIKSVKSKKPVGVFASIAHKIYKNY